MFDIFQFEQGFSSSGIPVFVKNLPWISGWVEVRIAIRAGARWDPPGKEGLAHFFEHMPFKGVVNFITSQAVQIIDDDVFIGSLNASTGFDGIKLEGKVQKDQIVTCLEFFRNFIFKPLLRPEDIEKEKGVIIQEMLSDFGEANMDLIRTYRKDFLLDHPFSRMNVSSIGWKDTVVSITLQDLAVFHREFFHRGNIMVLFMGDVTLQEVEEMTDCLTEGVSRDKATSLPLRAENSWPKPLCPERDISQREWLKISKKTKEVTDLSCWRVLPGTDNPEVSHILGDVLHEIIFNIVREEAGAAYHIGQNRNEFADIIIFGLEIKVAPGKAKKIQTAIKKALTGFSQKDKHKDLFERKKAVAIKNAIMADNRITTVADIAAAELLTFGRIIPFEEIIQKRQAVTYEDVRRLVIEEMNPDLLYWFIFRP